MLVVVLCTIGITICVMVAALGVISLYKDYVNVKKQLAEAERTVAHQKSYMAMQDGVIEYLKEELQKKES